MFLKLVSPIYSWWSVPPFGSTHYYLSDEAKKLITAIEYPDITTRFGNDICAWTDGSTDDASAHNDYIDNNGEDGKKNDGAIKVHWEKGFDKYKNFKFSSNDEDAYYYFGLMTHLVEDMAVPAHAYDIQHGNFRNMDNVE
ncbi:hypothetical protein KA977_14525, partial [Candidatus Dependentiae bacterium]|nr:hypothetical protein [Candidatus Dependentiae bacterium]